MCRITLPICLNVNHYDIVLCSPFFAVTITFNLSGAVVCVSTQDRLITDAIRITDVQESQWESFCQVLLAEFFNDDSVHHFFNDDP